MQREVVRATGHDNVSAVHQSTLEVTTDDWLTPAGDCIVGVDADRAPAAFAESFVEACRDETATIEVTLRVGDRTWQTVGRGDPALTFDSDRSLVCRTSDYVDDRTVVVDTTAAATDVDRTLVDALTAGAALELTLTVE